MSEQDNRLTIMAILPEIGPVGYATLVYKSHYPNFDNIPEIMDLNTIDKYCSKGAGKAMLDYMEKDVKDKGFRKIGIGVGFYANYGSAQRIYIKAGYIPDGKGAFYNGKPVVPYESYPIDDSLAIYMTKDL